MWEWVWQINILNKLHQQQIAKRNDEIESLGQLVASLTKEMVETNRQLMELEKWVSELEKK